jgi:hypothetical protein
MLHDHVGCKHCIICPIPKDTIKVMENSYIENSSDSTFLNVNIHNGNKKPFGKSIAVATNVQLKVFH